jgi:N-acetylglucosamine-6-phosphate deacetylase
MPKALLISGCGILAGGGLLKKGDLLVQGGKIRKIASRIVARDADVVPARGLLAAPGLIDTQINGGFGISFSNATPEQVLQVGRGLLGGGVTSYLPTIFSMPRATMTQGIRNLVAASKLRGGARIEGIHLEGPFLSPKKNGAHRLENLRLPAVEEFRDYHRAGEGLLRKMTLAPELPGAMDVIREGSKRGVIMSAGHSEATAEEVARAVLEGGLRHVTHVFNAMSPLHHRDETILNAALAIDRLSCGMIYDRDHVSRGAAALALRAKPRGQLVLVSDAVAAMGLPDGDFDSDGDHYVIRDGRVTVKANGRLAGSATPLLEGVRRIIEDLGVPPAEAIAMASEAPARLIGREGRLGVLRPGATADIVLFGKGLEVRAVYVGGERLHGNHH